MSRLFTASPLTDFGANYLMPQLPPPKLHYVPGPGAVALRRGVREESPSKPGVYGMIDRHGELIYLGKAKSLRARLLGYFRPKSRDRKMTRIIQHTSGLVWETCSSEFAALHRELELIRRWRPRFNVMGLPSGWRQTFLCLGRRPAPYAFLTRKPPATTLGIFGPILASVIAKEAVRRLNDWYRLRDCPKAQEMIFLDDGVLFDEERSPGCMRLELGTCLGPCIAACSRKDYEAQARTARRFLEGEDAGPLPALEKEMADAAARQQFERAAGLRDKYLPLSWLAKQLEQLREARREASFIYPVLGHDGQTVWYLIHQGRTVGAVPAPVDQATRQLAREWLEAVFERQQPPKSLPGKEMIEGVYLVASWFRRHTKQRRQCISVADALAHC